MTSSQNKKIGQFIRETMKDAVLYSDEYDDQYAKSEYKAIETMLRMMSRAKLMHPSTYIMFINVLTESYNNAQKIRKEQDNEKV